MNEDLKNRWEAACPKYQPFVVDGILDEVSWQSANPKIMFLLKESHISSNWYLIKGNPIDVTKATNPKNIHNIFRWNHLIKSAVSKNKLPDFLESQQALIELIKDDHMIRDIAYVNIKKCLGGSTSNSGDIRFFAEKDKGFLCEQISSINPDIILCGGTFEFYKTIFSNSILNKISTGLWKDGNRFIIDFNHPGHWQFPGGQRGLYDKLKNILKNMPH